LDNEVYLFYHKRKTFVLAPGTSFKGIDERGPIMQFQKYMWIIKEARAAYKPDFIIGINF
jgi:hypothetical protein